MASRRRSMLLLSLSLSLVEFYADLSFVSFLPFYFLPCSKIRSRRRRRRRCRRRCRETYTCIYVARRKEGARGTGIWRNEKEKASYEGKERKRGRGGDSIGESDTITMVTRFLELTWSEATPGNEAGRH